MIKKTEFFKGKASFIIMITMLVLFAATDVFSQMVTPNVRVNDEDAEYTFAGFRGLAVIDDNVYVIWADDRTGFGNIYFSKSEDGGETFSEDIMLSAPNDENLNIWPAIVADASGGIYVAWTGFTEPYMGPGSGANVWFTRSADEGNSFDTPIQITENDLSIFPSIGVYENYVYIFYGDATNLPYADYYLVRSTDGGDSFQDPIQVNDADCVEEVGFDHFTSLDIDPLTGHVYLAWVDGRREDSNGDIYFAKSTDNGVSVSDNVMVNDIGTIWANEEKLRPVVSVGEENMVYVVFLVESEVEDGARVYIALSGDGGNSFGTEILLAENDNHCYYYDAMALPDGTIGALMVTDLHGVGNNLWFVQPDVMPIVINDAHAYWRTPSLFLTGDGSAHAVWADDREGHYNIYYAKTIKCEPFDVPHFENFDDVTPPLLPFCWTGLGEGNYNITTEDWNYFSPPNSLNMYHDEESLALLALPEFVIEISGLVMSFKAYWHGGNDVLEAGVITDINDINSFELIQSIDLPHENQYYDYVVDFSEFEGEEGHIAFRYGSETIGTWGGIFLDDILIDETPTYTLTLDANPEEGGIVDGEGEYPEGEEVEISAEANEGWEFIGWIGDTEHVDDPGQATATVIMPAEDITLTANFELTNIVEGIQTIEISVFPNPARDKLTVESSEMIKQIRLIDTKGQVIKDIKANTTRINIEVQSLHTGIYFIQIHAADRVITEQVQIIR